MLEIFIIYFSINISSVLALFEFPILIIHIHIYFSDVVKISYRYIIKYILETIKGSIIFKILLSILLCILCYILDKNLAQNIVTVLPPVIILCSIYKSYDRTNYIICKLLPKFFVIITF